MALLARLRDLPLAALERAGIDPAVVIGAARLLADGRVRPPSPPVLARFAADLARDGRRGPADLVHLHALATPLRPALVAGGLRINWRELDRRANHVAHGLRALGIGPRDRVALLLHNGGEHVVCSLALGRLGAIAVQVGYRLKAREVAYLLADSGSRALVFHAQHAATVEEALAAAEGGPARDRCFAAGSEAAGFPRFEALLEAGEGDRPPPIDGAGGGGLMVYTSGTTGRPKGAARDLAQTGYGPILNFIADLPMRPDERHLVVTPLYHSAAALFTNLTLGLGGTLIVHEHFDPEAVLRDIERERVTSLALVPTMWNRLLQLGRDAIRRPDLSSLRWIMSVAAPLPQDLAGRIEEAFGPILYNFYGATETGVVTLARPGEHTARPGTVGRLVRGSEIRLLDDEGREVPEGEVGEIWVRNRMVIGGYHGNPEATRDALRDGFFSVGDLGRRDADGYYYLAERKSDLVISGGVNVYPLEIEERLHAHPAVHDCAVVGVPDPDWGEALAAFVVLEPGHAASETELARFVGEELAGYKKPRRFVFLESLPRNPTGKVLKRELRRRLVEEPGEG